jgi:hypothetical protein
MIGIDFKGLLPAIVLVLATLECAGGRAATPGISIDRSPSVGQSFTLTWTDLDLLATSAFATTDIILAFDPTVLNRVDIAPGSIFGQARTYAYPNSPFVIAGFEAYRYDAFTILQDLPPKLPTTGDVLSVGFDVLSRPASGETLIFVLGIDGLAGIPGYYEVAPGFGVPLGIAAIPEPTTVASVLAGLALLCPLATRRRRCVVDRPRA